MQRGVRHLLLRLWRRLRRLCGAQQSQLAALASGESPQSLEPVVIGNAIHAPQAVRTPPSSSPHILQTFTQPHKIYSSLYAHYSVMPPASCSTRTVSSGIMVHHYIPHLPTLGQDPRWSNPPRALCRGSADRNAGDELLTGFQPLATFSPK